MQYRTAAAIAAVIATGANAQFNLYPPVDPTRLATAFNISTGCLAALNATVNCDQTLLTMANTVDNYLWDISNVTDLCTQSCVSSTASWFSNAQSACASDTLTFQGRQVPAWHVPGRTVDGLNIACLTPSTNLSQLPGVLPPTAPASSKRDATGYCLIDSYSWTGSDIIRPDCTDPDNSQEPQCSDPTNVTDFNQRLSNLYTNDLLCSDCFVKNFYLRLASPYLPDVDYSDYLILQYYDIIEVCNYGSMPNLTIQYAPTWNDAPGWTDGRRDNNTIVPFTGGPTLSPAANTTADSCTGQSLTYSQLNITASDFNYNTTFCDALSIAYNVSSGDLYQAFENYNCDLPSPNVTDQTWCVPQGCTVYHAQENSTCTQVAAVASNSQYNITSQQIIQFNPSLQGFCDQLAQQYLCISLPGGTYIPPPVNASSTNAGQQQRGGGDSSSTGNQTVTGTGSPAVTVSAGGSAPSPTQSGIVSDCNVFAAALSGEGCYAFAQEHNVTANNLYAWNSVLGTDGKYCSNEFWNGYYYCIATVSSQPSPTSSPTPVSSGQPAPSPTQSGIVSSCDKYAQAQSGDSCSSFATNQNIGTAQLYTWNTQLGTTGQNCSTEFWAGYYYCVHAPDATSTQPTAAPSPTQSGIVSNCNRYYQAQSGDSCYSFAQENAITSDQLYTWNTQLGASGENCNTQFWAGYYYCTGVSASKRHVESSHGTSLNPRLTYFPLDKRDLPTGTCNAQTPCANGACCGSDNLCGYSDKSCGSGCQHNCDAKAECGPYAAAGKQKCPLNVCCSEFGFCGSTPEFCTWTNSADPKYSQCDPQYGSCGAVDRPSCGSGGNNAGQRSIGYYESWSNTRACQSVAPEDLNLDGFTSINFAFSFFDPASFTITPMDSNGASLYNRFTALKQKKPGLKAYISVGGWSFTDPGSTQQAFSDMVSSSGNRATFINALVKFMDTYSFDGVDIDWEYPGADDRGGVEADTANYVALTKDMRAAFGSRYGLTVTIPTSYWYLQHFDLPGIQANIDWFNLMAYDLHGTWDAQSKFVGPYIAPHTNLTEIDTALDLLWRAGVNSNQVVLGQGWYGRSFTLKDPSCNAPNGVCQFTSGANPGPCSQAAGILDYQEIKDIIDKNSLTPTWDHTAGVKWITWDNNQWVSYDDADTFAQKRNLANERCLGGTMVWAMDQVDQTANNGFTSNVSPSQQSDANQMSLDSLSRLRCYISDCNAACKAGTNPVAQFNGQPGQLSTAQRCPAKAYRNLCCDAQSHMGTCQWRGYRGAGLSCVKGCAEGETEITTNTNQHDDKGGDKSCHGGLQSFCCAGYKPASSTLEDDLKDAAKSAVEAVAEQAALDIAAKAFCRVAVPALLVPLELIEDAIPIVGEILDAIEIAATPAIIEGCVKGIEKEGKAEFKVFGKTHTLAMDTPKAKPTTVPDRPAPKDDDPHSNGDKDGSCPRNAKRAPTVERVALPRMQVLQAYSGKASLEKWNDGDGWALRFMNPSRNSAGYGKPQHYGLVAGYVRVTQKRDTRANRRYDCNGNQIQTMEYDWISNGYDLVTDVGKQSGATGFNRPTIDFGTAQNQVDTTNDPDAPKYVDISSGADGQQWATGFKPSMNRDYLVWTSMGPIRPGVTFANTNERCNAYCAKYPDYNILLNNCYTFANQIYAWMKDASKPLKREEHQDVLEATPWNTTVAIVV